MLFIKHQITLTLPILQKEFFVRVLVNFLIYKSNYSNLIASKIDKFITVKSTAQWQNIHVASLKNCEPFF